MEPGLLSSTGYLRLEIRMSEMSVAQMTAAQWAGRQQGNGLSWMARRQFPARSLAPLLGGDVWWRRVGSQALGKRHRYLALRQFGRQRKRFDSSDQAHPGALR